MIALFLVALQVTSPSGGSTLKPHVELLRTWLDAADAHAPNTIDAPLRAVSAMSSEDLTNVVQDLRSLLILVREPGTTTFQVSWGTSSTARRISYTERDLQTLGRLAAQIRNSGDVNRPLKRGALLHGDIARLVPLEEIPDEASVPSGPFSQTVLLTDDGQRTRLVRTVSHWSAAMAMLDEVRPKEELRRTPRGPAESPFVRLWYRAMLTWQVREQQFVTTVFRRAGDLFPDDPDIQFLIGCRHEAEATPGMQAALGSNRLAPPTGVGSMRGELEDAEEAFRHALAVRPDAIDARVHHGRVLELLGRHADAVAALRRATGAPKSPPLDYVAALFLGRALEETGDMSGAREAYRQAASLATSAPAPLLALSALAERAGDHAAAVTLVRQAMDQQDDPLWTYLEWGGREADALLAEVAAE